LLVFVAAAELVAAATSPGFVVAADLEVSAVGVADVGADRAVPAPAAAATAAISFAVAPLHNSFLHCTTHKNYIRTVPGNLVFNRISALELLLPSLWKTCLYFTKTGSITDLSS